MEAEYRKVLTMQEGSGMTSVWNEYFCLTPNGNGTATLEVCQYEALAEIPQDEGWDEVLPGEIEGKKVVGVEDDFIVGGELECYDDGRVFTFSSAEIQRAIDWIKSEYFEVTDEIVRTAQRRETPMRS
jgi:hypothetical protein